jgi:hypothetical protein
MKFEHSERYTVSHAGMNGMQDMLAVHAGQMSETDSTALLEGKEFKLQELTMLSIAPVIRNMQRWWLQRAERHYLICADVEEQRAREAQMNVAYYQKRAALARSAARH